MNAHRGLLRAAGCRSARPTLLAAALALLPALATPAWALDEDLPATQVEAAPILEGIRGLQAFRQHWGEALYQDQKTMLADLRSRHHRARAAGDRHGAWLTLAWLLRCASVFDVQAAEALYAQAEAAAREAQRTGDAIAAFELEAILESMGTQQLAKAPSPERQQRLERLAQEIGGPFHQALLWKLRGVLALQAGQGAEAYFRFQQALTLMRGDLERAELHIYLALALQDHRTRAAANLAVGHLDDVLRRFPPERYPGMQTAAIRISQLLTQLGRTGEAVQQAERALQAARDVDLDSALARAHLARGRAWLAGGELRSALADFDAAPLQALPIAERLQALSGRTVVLARLGDASARDALRAARAFAASQPVLAPPARAEFQEDIARAWQALGEPALALAHLTEAAALRRQLAGTAQQELGRARADADALDRELAQAESRQLALSVLTMLLLTTLAGAALAQVRQRQRLRAQRAEVDALAVAGSRLQAADDTRSRQITASCDALAAPALALRRLCDTRHLLLQDAARRARHLDAMRQCSRSLVDAAEALLDMTRLQDGSYAPRPERFDVDELLGEISQLIAPRATSRGLAWVLKASPSGVFSDRRLLRRILVNLLGHLVQHAGQGRIELQLMPAEQQLHVEILCTDPGMPPLPGAEPGAAADDEGTPTGLGLAVALQACELLGHPLTVRRSAARGLLLRLSLPRAFVPLADDSLAPTAELDRSVAIVEDDAFCRITLMNALIDAGLDAQAFASLEEMVGPGSRFGSSAPGLLITDLHLGDQGDVTEALRELRRRPAWRDVPVLMLTGDTRDDVGTLAAELGVALAYKPISVRRLLERVALLRGAQPLPQRSPTTASAPARPAPLCTETS